MQVLIVWDRMGDYHRSRVDAYRAMYDSDIVYTADLGAGDDLYKWQNTSHHHHFVLSEKKSDRFDLWQRLKKFKDIVKTHKIDKVVLSGYGKSEYLLFTFWLKLKGLDCYMFAESWYRGKTFVDAIKGLFLRRFVKGIFTSGKRAEVHFTAHLNYPQQQMITGYSVVDNAHFTFERSLVEVTKALAHKPIILCVARYAEEKNLSLLIAAFESSKLANNWQLQLVGDGPLKEVLQDQITNTDNVQLMNWKAYQDLPLLYKKASCFILPSQFEPWGLVVNEAMAASLPLIISDACGCLPDVICDNGYTFKAASKNELIAVLNQLQGNSALELCEMGLNSYERIKHFTTVSWAKSLNSLIR